MGPQLQGEAALVRLGVLVTMPETRQLLQLLRRELLGLIFVEAVAAEVAVVRALLLEPLEMVGLAALEALESMDALS